MSINAKVYAIGLKRGRNMQIKIADFSDPNVLDLIRLHIAGMTEICPPEHVRDLAVSKLRAPDIDLFTVWNDDALMGIGALRYIDTDQAELISMRTHPDHIRKGVAVKILDHAVATVKAKGITQLSLQTGSGPGFAAAIKLYRRYGFLSGAVFGDHIASGFNQFFHMELS